MAGFSTTKNGPLSAFPPPLPCISRSRVCMCFLAIASSSPSPLSPGPRADGNPQHQGSFRSALDNPPHVRRQALGGVLRLRPFRRPGPGDGEAVARTVPAGLIEALTQPRSGQPRRRAEVLEVSCGQTALASLVDPHAARGNKFVRMNGGIAERFFFSLSFSRACPSSRRGRGVDSVGNLSVLSPPRRRKGGGSLRLFLLVCAVWCLVSCVCYFSREGAAVPRFSFECTKCIYKV